MACNCKNTITSFLGGDVPNPTTFLNCGEADGTYNNPLETGKTQCVAENNVLRILDEYYVSGTVKNAGQIVFERTYTADTANWDEWTNTGTYFSPIQSKDWKLSATSLTTSANISAAGSITTGTHDGSDILYINRYSAAYPYGHIYAGRSSQNTAVGLRFVTRNTLGAQEESFSLLGNDRKATFQGNVVISGTNTTLNTLSANTAINVGNGDGTVSANTFTAPQISIGGGSVSIDKTSGVITGTTIAGKYSGVTTQNSGTDASIGMTVGTFRPNMLVDVAMGGGTGDLTITLPAMSGWLYGKYIFTFYGTPNAGAAFALVANGSEKFYGMSICLDGNEIISNASRITFGAGKTIAGTKIEVIAHTDELQVIVYSTANKADVTPS
jgi:lipoprotein signal peptidase